MNTNPAFFSSSKPEEGPKTKNFSLNENTNLTILQTISQSKFWLLWTILLSISVMQNFINAYQKSYGMIFIGDDFFFTYVGFASNLLNGSSRLVWGYIYDLKGFKVSSTQISKANKICTEEGKKKLKIKKRLIAHRGICPSNHFKIMQLLTEAI